MLATSFARDEERIKKTEMKKGKFILATSCLDDEILTTKDILSAYRGEIKIAKAVSSF